MHFDDTVTIGNVITIVVTLAGGFLFYAKLSYAFGQIKLKVDTMWEHYLETRNHHED